MNKRNEELLVRKIFSCILAALLVLNIIPQVFAESEGTLAGWGRYYHDCTSKDAQVELDNTTSRHGSYSAKATYTLPSKSNRYLTFSMLVNGMKKGAKYKYGISVKAKNAGSVYVSMGWKEHHYLTPLGKTFDWMDLSYSFTNTYDFTQMDFLIIIESTTKAMWFDDIYLREVNEDGSLGKNLITNGTFDVGGDVQETENEQVNGLYSLYKDIESRDTFTLDEIKQVLGAFKYAPVYEAKNISIDGNLADWEGYPKFGLPTKPDQYQIYIKGSNKDVDAYCQYAYDKENFYLAIHVKDDVFYEDPEPNMYWNGDSIQLAMCDVDQVYDAEIGFAHHQKTGIGTVHSSNYGESALSTIDLKTSQNGDETIYEAKIPWKLRYEDGNLPKGFLFDVIVNDNDTKGRAYCVELAPGIAEGKTSVEFPYLEFMNEDSGYYAWIQGPDVVTQDEDNEFSYYLVNEGDEKEITLSYSNTDEVETVKVPAHSGIRKTIKAKFSGHGDIEYAIDAKCEDKNVKATYSVEVQPSVESFDSVFKELDDDVVSLKAKLDECALKGISTDYETVNYSVLERFAQRIREDVNATEYERAFYVYDVCKELYSEAMEACDSYLNGTATPKTVTRYVTGDVSIDGRMVYATTETDGLVEKRPFFFTGYGHFPGSIAPDIPNFQNFGTNIVQISLEPEATIAVTNNEQMFRFDSNSWAVKNMKNYFKSAEENNIQICLLLGIHNLGSAIRKAYPEIVGKSVADVVVQQGDIKVHPIMKKLIKTHVKGVLEAVGDSPALNSICLSNEPTNNCNSDYYKPYWAQYLTELYKADISLLNTAYGTKYKGFLDVPMPTAITSTKWFYDYKQFNDKVLTEFHQIIAEAVREYNPNIKVHAKMMSMSTKSETGSKRNFLTYGTDHELMIPYSDYNGNDCYGCLYNMTGWNLLEGMEFYDMQVGMNNAPVFNSEDHLIPDKNVNFEPLQADFVETSQWQGYMHAKAASTIWAWDRSYDKSSDFYGLISCRPDCIAKVGKTNFDVNRLAYEVKAIVEKEPTIAMITSTNTRVWNMTYMNCMWNVYTNCLYNGQKVKFVTESTINELGNYKALVLTNLNNVKASTLEEIKKFVDNGGKIIMLGDNCLKYNEINELNNSDIVSYIKSKSQFISTQDDSMNITVPTSDGFFDIVTNLTKEIGEDEIYVIDTKTNQRVRDVEFEYSAYNDGYVLNMANYSYDEEPKQVKIYVNGVEAKNIYDLRNETQLSDIVELQRYKPVFVKLGDNAFAPLAKELSVNIDGKPYSFTDAKPFIDERNRTLVPIRFVAEALGAEVIWNDGIVNINKGEDSIEYSLGEYFGLKNGEKIEFDTCGIMKNDRVFVPVRYISELLSAKVEWNAKELAVYIVSNNQITE